VDDFPTSFGEGVAVCTNVALIVAALAIGLPDADFLPLTDEEEKAWARVNDKMGKLAKSKAAKRFIKNVERAAPGAAYALAAGKIFAPRALMVAQLLKERKLAREAAARATVAPPSPRAAGGPTSAKSRANEESETRGGRLRAEGLGHAGGFDDSLSSED